MNDCKCGHSLRDHAYNFTIGKPEPCLSCDCKSFEENIPPTSTCNDCKQRPKTRSGRCYHDTLKRPQVVRSSEACSNIKEKEHEHI